MMHFLIRKNFFDWFREKEREDLGVFVLDYQP